MAEKFQGWNLYDKVIIVEKIIFEYVRQPDGTSKLVDTGRRQGYLVDPKSKSQLESALNWAKFAHYEYDKELGRSKLVTTHEGVVNEFTNEDFEIELLDSAEGSSQGGKLSFWNCKITKDGKTWEIGINADLLLKALVSCTWVNGKCTEPVMFARCKGGVGVLTKSSEEYKQAQADMEKRANINKGKTTKWEYLKCYETLKESSVYFGKVYQWYEPIKEKTYNGWTTITGFKQLEKPVEHHLMFLVDSKTKASEYLNDSYYGTISKTCPSRKFSGQTIENDITAADIEKYLWKECWYKYSLGKESYYVNERKFGFSTDPNNPPKYIEENKDFIREQLKITVE